MFQDFTIISNGCFQTKSICKGVHCMPKLVSIQSKSKLTLWGNITKGFIFLKSYTLEARNFTKNKLFNLAFSNYFVFVIQILVYFSQFALNFLKPLFSFKKLNFTCIEFSRPVLFQFHVKIKCVWVCVYVNFR